MDQKLSYQKEELAINTEGAMLGISGFGESAPAEVLYAYFGFTVENIVAKVKSLLQ
jgi:transketolase